MIAYDSISIIDVTDGQTLYTWHMYADDKEGNGISSDPTDKAYVGVAYNQTTEMPPDDVDPSIFTWSLWEPPPIVVENQIAQYIFGNKDEPLTDSNKENDGWSNECPNPWEHLDSEKKPLYYVWRRYETHWSNDATTYVGLMILDDYEVANILAQQAGYKSVGEWCKGKNITIIDGSTIMTGTINADKIDVNDLIVEGINALDENIKISGDKVNIEGQVTFSSLNSEVQNKLNSSVTSTKIEYALSNSSTTAPTSGWSTTAPQWEADKYMWQKTTITKGDGTELPPTTTCIQGAQGRQGIQGPKGDAGLTSYFHIKYSANADGNPMTEVPSTYIGTYVDYIVDDSDDYSKYTWSRFEGMQGNQGIPGGKGDKGETSYLHIKYADVAEPTSEQMNDTGGDYIGQYVDFVQADSTDPSKYTWTKIKGEQGKKGDTGATVASTITQFYLSTSSTTQLGGSWSPTPSAWEKDSYMWTREQYILTDGTTVYSDPVLDNTFTTISQWCSSTNMTLIDGANIATGTITANKITTGQLQSNGYEDKNSTVYSDKGTRFNLDDGSITAKKFAVTKTGTLWAKGANIEGDITATSGSFTGTVTTAAGDIGGWVIEPGFIVSENKSVGFYSGDDDGIEMTNTTHYSLLDGSFKTVRFFAGAPDTDNLSSAPFKVLSDGSLYASAADITGNITATSGKIGGWSLNGTELVNYSGTKDAAGYYPNSFCMQTAGNGALNALAIGKANENTWGQAAFRVTVDGEVYATAGKIGGFSIENSNLRWRESYREGLPDIKLECIIDGDLDNPLKISTMHIAHNEIFCGKTDGLERIYGITIDDNDIWFKNKYYDSCTIGYEAGVCYLYGKWKSTSGWQTSSDRNVKNNIQDVPDVYEILFDNLQSKIFKYNDEKSDEYHTGFEAQGVDEARQKAGLTRKDFAAVCIDNEGTEKESWGLRYDEFISLNTWQIQKLKTRVTELEERLSKLEEK
ncbi:MAG: hypothetical protein UH850_11275 [Paludibacteraceae bacterium]|nr:hypothetical protein [Paludibacteraceae bacterium]